MLWRRSVANVGGNPVTLTPCEVSNLSLGSHTTIIEVSDGTNPPVPARDSIEILDNTNPTFAPLTNKGILWPPNHQMVDIVIDATADNSCIVHLSVSVSSNEPIEGTGDVDIAPDWYTPVIDESTGTILLQLRSERSGKGNGRIYSLLITATDLSGNASSSTMEIKVPHSQGKE